MLLAEYSSSYEAYLFIRSHHQSLCTNLHSRIAAALRISTILEPPRPFGCVSYAAMIIDHSGTTTARTAPDTNLSEEPNARVARNLYGIRESLKQLLETTREGSDDSDLEYRLDELALIADFWAVDELDRDTAPADPENEDLYNDHISGLLAEAETAQACVGRLRATLLPSFRGDKTWTAESLNVWDTNESILVALEDSVKRVSRTIDAFRQSMKIAPILRRESAPQAVLVSDRRVLESLKTVPENRGLSKESRDDVLEDLVEEETGNETSESSVADFDRSTDRSEALTSELYSETESDSHPASIHWNRTRGLYPTFELENDTLTDDVGSREFLRYQRLPGHRWMRLLQLHPAPRRNDAIWCEIELVDFELVERTSQAAPRYEALSWCRGNGPLSHAIRIRDKSAKPYYVAKVSEHLFRALVALRHKHQARTLWIDTLCMDLDNYEELNQYVPQMGEIYGKADNVIIWLGHGTPKRDRAMDFIAQEVLGILNFEVLCEEQYLESWTALLELMKADWFRRRWVVQEVLLAKRAAVHCGAHFIEWSSFTAAVSILASLVASSKKLNEFTKTPSQLGDVKLILEEIPSLPSTRLVEITEPLRDGPFRGPVRSQATLEDLVTQLATFETSDPRDNIYSLLALAKDCQPVPVVIPDRLNGKVLTEQHKRLLLRISKSFANPRGKRYVVDYRQGVVDVYQQFVAFAISNSDPRRALDIICRPFAAIFTVSQEIKFDQDKLAKLTHSEGETRVKLPSWISSIDDVPFGREAYWVPGWKRNIYSMERRRGDPFVSSNGYSINYNAAMGKSYNKIETRFRKRNDHYSMYVQGFILDHVGKVEAPACAGVIPARWLKRGQEYELHPGRDPNAFWKTLVADRSPYGNALPYYKAALHAVLKDAFQNMSNFDTGKCMRMARSQIVSSTLRQVQATIWERSLFGTQRDHHLGIGPSEMRSDDLVCVLYGLSVPVILRKSDKTTEDMQQEAVEDEQDYQKRLERLKPLLKRLFQRKAAQRPGQEAQKTSASASDRIPEVVPNARLVAGALHRLCDTLLFMLGWIARGFQIFSDVKTRVTTFVGLHPVLKSLLTARSVALCIVVGILLAMLPRVFGLIGLALGSRKIALCLLMAVLPLVITDDLVSRALTRSRQGFWEQDASALGTTNDPANHRSNDRTETTALGPAAGGDKYSAEYYTVIGECYVHGMMNGEAIQWQENSAALGPDRIVKARIFELR